MAFPESARAARSGHSNRRLVCGILLAGGLLALGCAVGAWLPLPKEERASAADTMGDEEVLRRQLLEAHRADVRRRDRGREKIFADLMAGRLTFWEAAAGYRALDRRLADPDRWARLMRVLFPGCSEEECYCRNLLQNLREVGRNCAKARRLAEQLAGQFEDRLRREGTLRLPEVVSPSKSPHPVASH